MENNNDLIRDFLNELDTIFDKARLDIEEEYGRKIDGLYIPYSKWEYLFIRKFLDEINKNSERFTISLDSIRERTIHVSLKKNR